MRINYIFQYRIFYIIFITYSPNLELVRAIDITVDDKYVICGAEDGEIIIIDLMKHEIK